MDDKCIMEGLLLDAKSVCDLYMHGAIESSTAQVRQTFSNAFDDRQGLVSDRHRA